MIDIIESYGDSLLQHGKNSNRIYLMKCAVAEAPQLIPQMNQLAFERNYSKIIAKIPESLKPIFTAAGYHQEATIPGFYQGRESCQLLAKYFCPNRKNLANGRELKNILDQAIAKKNTPTIHPLPQEFTIRRLREADIPTLAQLYHSVFKSYPFPIFDATYLRETMIDHVIYYGVFDQDLLVAVSSSETDPDNGNSEMTDFAVLPAYRGHQLALHLLKEMEIDMLDNGYHLLYTIARAASAAMNTTFARAHYHYGGTLINNTQISGSIESMNIWYKKLTRG
ncbi:putative beta-lysine N-acetyltransferase [Acetobacterium wieringae]|uniref:putative beta-lysine N-acetyltransferase n=1 Tax=Acetobacterium wieringae TaxID=52694 RepID=UPI0026EADEE1|nr:putative beta-lysine N-acetyltransferase [Acetobacterium wieringae]